MRSTDTLVLLGTIAAQTGRVAAASSDSLPRGVGPEFAKFYTNTKTFSCITNPSVVLSAAQVNDNSCDCPDGSDEPGTAACANIDPISPPQPLPGSATGTTNTTPALPGFWCNNAGHVGAYVPFMYVNDGVCDYDLCCDGSDESAHAGGVRCENRCDAIGKEYRRVEADKKAAKERSAAQRRTLVTQSGEMRRQVEAKVASLRDEIAVLEKRKVELQRKFEDVERQERGKVVQGGGEGQGGKVGVLVRVARRRVDELRDTLDRVLDRKDDLQDKVEQLEDILRKLKDEYNPNFNDEGVKAAVKSWDNYAAGLGGEDKQELSDADVLEILKEDSETNGVNWKEFEEGDEQAASDSDIVYNLEAYLPPFARDYVHDKLNALRTWMVANGILVDKPATSASGESRRVTEAREALDAVKAEVTSRTNTLEDQKRDLDKDYGPDGVFRALKGKCVSTAAGEYDYELCWMDRTTQKSKKGHGNTNMGSFVRIDRETADEEDRADGKGLGRGSRMVLRYENGQGCWNGPNRRTDVWLACAEQDEVWRVSESEKCVYRMEVGTPAACEDVGEPGVRTKDEL